ncbi:MAG: hypothetical protein R3B84_23660 [Zavarzinella sp.]
MLIWPILGSFAILVIVGFVLFCFVYLVNLLGFLTALKAKLEREGEIVKAWLVFANENLFRKSSEHDSLPAMFVCTLDDVSDLEEKLQEWAEAIRHFKARDNDAVDEQIIETVVRTEYGNRYPVRIPKWITGKKYKAYFVCISVYYKFLPDGKLTKPYIYCKFYKGEEHDDGDAEMVAYPKYDV